MQLRPSPGAPSGDDTDLSPQGEVALRPDSFQTGDDLFPRDRMIAKADAAGVVNGIRECTGHGADGRLAEALRSVEPPRLEAIDEHLRLIFGNVHDCRNPVRQVADAVMTGSRKFPIPRNRIGRHLIALYQGSVHVG